MNSNNFNLQAQPVMCVFFPFKQDFQEKLNSAMGDDSDVEQLMGVAIQEFSSFLLHVHSRGGTLLEPMMTDDGVLIDCSTDVFTRSKEGVFHFFDLPKQATQEQIAFYRDGTEMKEAIVEYQSGADPQDTPPTIN